MQQFLPIENEDISRRTVDISNDKVDFDPMKLLSIERMHMKKLCVNGAVLKSIRLFTVYLPLHPLD